MKRLSLIGQQLIHTYPLIPRFNGCNLDKAQAYKPGWVKAGKLADHIEPEIEDCRVTRVWSPDADEAKRLAEALLIDTVCATLDEAVEGCDGVLIQDEVADSRTRLIERCLSKGVPVFADKTLADDPQKAADLIVLAEDRDVPLRSWSQLYFLPCLDAVREAEPRGIASLNYRINLEILPMYAVHIFSMMQGAFTSRVQSYRPIDDHDRREALIELRDGTRVFLHASPSVPPHGRLHYCSQNENLLADEMDQAACFDAAAQAVAALFRGDAHPPGPDHDAMAELARLVRLFVDGGCHARTVEFT